MSHPAYPTSASSSNQPDGKEDQAAAAASAVSRASTQARLDAMFAASSTPDHLPGSAESASADAVGGHQDEKKKRRVLRACMRCAVKKVKCDGHGPPCGVCQVSGIPDQCHFNPNPKKRGPPKGYWAAQRKSREDPEALSTFPFQPKSRKAVHASPRGSSSRKRSKGATPDTPLPSTTTSMGDAPSIRSPAPHERIIGSLNTNLNQVSRPSSGGPQGKVEAHSPPHLETDANHTSSDAPRPRLPPVSHMKGPPPPPPLVPASGRTPAPESRRNMFGLNPSPSALLEGPALNPSLTPLEQRLVEIYMAFVHDHWPLLAPNILFAPSLGASTTDAQPETPTPTFFKPERPKTLLAYIASLKSKAPLLFQLICAVAMSTLAENRQDGNFSVGGGTIGLGPSLVAGIPVQPGEMVTGDDLAHLIDKCRRALLPHAHIRAIWVVQALFLLALADYSAGRMHEGWQSSGLVCRLVFDMNLHSRQGEAAVERMMRLATVRDASTTNTGSNGSGPAPATASSIDLVAQANAKRHTTRFMHTMLADIAMEEQVTAQEERAMYAVAGAYTIDEMIQVRRRIFWCTFILDKTVSVITERPCMLRSAEVNVGFPIPGGLDDTQPWLTNSSAKFLEPNVVSQLKGVPARIDASLTVVAQLCVITEHIMNTLYSPARRALARTPDVFRDDRSTSTKTSTEWWDEDSEQNRDEGAVLASRWFSDSLSLWGSSGGTGNLLNWPDPHTAMAESYLRIMRMLTLWSEYMPAPMRARRMPLTYCQPPPPNMNPLGPTELLVMPPRHKRAPPSFLTMRAWTHLNVLLLHRPFIAHPHLLHFDLEKLRNFGFAPALSTDQPDAPAGAGSTNGCQRPSSTVSQSSPQGNIPTPNNTNSSPASMPSSKPPSARMKVSVTSLLVEQRRHRTKKSSTPETPAAPASGRKLAPESNIQPNSSQLLPPDTKGRGAAFWLSLSHPAQVCIQAAAEVIDIADAYKGLYPSRKLPSIWVFMLFQAGTIVSSFSMNLMTRRKVPENDSAAKGPAHSTGTATFSGVAQGSDQDRMKRANDTAARCRSLLARCIASLEEIGLSHPSAGKLVRILQSLSDVSSTVDATAASVSVSTAAPSSTVSKPSSDQQRSQLNCAPSSNLPAHLPSGPSSASMPFGQARESSRRPYLQAANAAPGPTIGPANSLDASVAWTAQELAQGGATDIPISEGRSPWPQQAGRVTLAAPVAGSVCENTASTNALKPESGSSQANPLTLLAEPIGNERSLFTAPSSERIGPSETPHETVPGSTSQLPGQLGTAVVDGPMNGRADLNAAAPMMERAAWEPFWNQMPFGENWDSWRTFLTQVLFDETPTPSLVATSGQAGTVVASSAITPEGTSGLETAPFTSSLPNAPSAAPMASADTSFPSSLEPAQRHPGLEYGFYTAPESRADLFANKYGPAPLASTSFDGSIASAPGSAFTSSLPPTAPTLSSQEFGGIPPSATASFIGPSPMPQEWTSTKAPSLHPTAATGISNMGLNLSGWEASRLQHLTSRPPPGPIPHAGGVQHSYQYPSGP